MKKPFFEPTDFTFPETMSVEYLSDRACALANEKLEKESQSWVTVWFNDDKTMTPYWEASSRQDKLHTHAAKLAFIEELPKKECEHQPIGRIGPKDNQWYKGSVSYSHGLVQPTSYECQKCGVELIPSWSAK